MLANNFTKFFRDRWRGALISFISLMAMYLFALSVYRNFDVNIYQQMPDIMKTIMGIPAEATAASLATGVYLAGLGSWVLVGLMIAYGSASIASEESDGTIGLLLGNPVSRNKVLISKTLGMTVLMGLIVAVVWGLTYAFAAMLSTDFSGIQVGALCLHVFFIVLFFGFLAMAIGGWTGNRGMAAGISTGIMIVSIFATGLLPLIDGWEDLARIFPWYYLNSSTPLFNGVDWGQIGILAGCIVVFFIVSIVGVNRRDLKSRNVGVTLVDRLRNYPATRKIITQLAGSARVSRIWIKTLTEQQALLAITGYALVLTGILIGVLYNYMPVDTMAQLVETYPEIDAIFKAFGGGNFATPEGFFQLEVFSLVAPAGTIVVGIVIGARAITGEESKRTMGLLLANPVKRSTIVLEKTMSMLIAVVVTGLTIFIGTALGSVFGGLDMNMANIAAASLLATLLGIAFGMLAMMLAGLTGQGRIATFGSIGIVLASYIISQILPLSSSLADFANWSPYYYYQGGDPLINGMNWGHAAVFGVMIVVFTVLTVYFFQRRDLRYIG